MKRKLQGEPKGRNRASAFFYPGPAFNNKTFFYISGVQLGFLRKLPELVELTHQYSEPGTYSLSISVNSIVGPSTSVQQSVVIGEAPCVLDSLRMLGTGESSAQCPEIQQEYEYSLYSSLKINCQAFNELKYD